MRIMGIDVASVNLMYESGSDDLILCTNERYLLELHRFMLMAPAYKYVKECWENDFDKGQSWYRRCRKLAAYNNRSRGKILRNWADVATYYCIPAMSSFSCHYDKWRLVSEHFPTEPDYESMRSWSKTHKEKNILFYKRNIYDFPISMAEENTLIYLHMPNNFASYGCGYVWSKRKLEFVSRELNQLARDGFKICVSARYMRMGRIVNGYADYFDPELFERRIYTELKAERYIDLPDQEVYLVANL